MVVLEPDWLCWDGFGRLMRPTSPEQDTVNPAITKAAGKVRSYFHLLLIRPMHSMKLAIDTFCSSKKLFFEGICMILFSAMAH